MVFWNWTLVGPVVNTGKEEPQSLCLLSTGGHSCFTRLWEGLGGSTLQSVWFVIIYHMNTFPFAPSLGTVMCSAVHVALTALDACHSPQELQ